MTTTMQDLEIVLAHHPGTLAALGRALGEAGVSLEGGGVFATGSTAVAHYLVLDGPAARDAVEHAGLGPACLHDVVMLRLDQETPGQLGTVAALLADAGVNVEAQYSDHAGNLVLVVDPAHHAACAEVARAWGERQVAARP
ncbi:hypothetical protein LEP48_12715 [Isoptericola sp. NEAU-Y5]|uniref:ACT domain-containing protein n=1 Tax=Isoptericola luteus TaxID=2879484 RepID=A0ABS7ZGR0_9MICO|nr:hypothetical protein [Isoptericola sp. NEAU-Y5]MCA5894203.1 hypothetical protein [Isoptericola sp. NEAU-Y5]